MFFKKERTMTIMDSSSSGLFPCAAELASPMALASTGNAEGGGDDEDEDDEDDDEDDDDEDEDEDDDDDDDCIFFLFLMRFLFLLEFVTDILTELRTCLDCPV